MIGLPPLKAGALNVTAIWALPGATAGAAGGSGTVDGITVAEAPESGPVPSAFLAATVHVYVLPFVRLETVMGDAAAGRLVPGAPPSEDVQVAV